MLITEIKIIEGHNIIDYWKKPVIMVNGKYLVAIEFLSAVTYKFGKEVEGKIKQDSLGNYWIDDFFTPKVYPYNGVL